MTSDLAVIATIAPPSLLGPDGLPDPRPLPTGRPSPAYLWMASELAWYLDTTSDPWVSVFTAERLHWVSKQVGGLSRDAKVEGVSSTGLWFLSREVPTPEARARQVAAVVEALAAAILRGPWTPPA